MFLLVSIFLISSLVCVSLAEYPEHPLQIIVGFSAGGSTDVMARLISDGLGKLKGKILRIDHMGCQADLLNILTISNALIDVISLKK